MLSLNLVPLYVPLTFCDYYAKITNISFIIFMRYNKKQISTILHYIKEQFYISIKHLYLYACHAICQTLAKHFKTC